jgi:hypothetical protein
MVTSPTKNNNNSNRCMEQSHLSGFCLSFPCAGLQLETLIESHL